MKTINDYIPLIQEQYPDLTKSAIKSIVKQGFSIIQKIILCGFHISRIGNTAFSFYTYPLSQQDLSIRQSNSKNKKLFYQAKVIRQTEQTLKNYGKATNK